MKNETSARIQSDIMPYPILRSQNPSGFQSSWNASGTPTPAASPHATSDFSGDFRVSWASQWLGDTMVAHLLKPLLCEWLIMDIMVVGFGMFWDVFGSKRSKHAGKCKVNFIIADLATSRFQKLSTHDPWWSSDPDSIHLWSLDHRGHLAVPGISASCSESFSGWSWPTAQAIKHEPHGHSQDGRHHGWPKAGGWKVQQGQCQVLQWQLKRRQQEVSGSWSHLHKMRTPCHEKKGLGWMV